MGKVYGELLERGVRLVNLAKSAPALGYQISKVH